MSSGAKSVSTGWSSSGTAQQNRFRINVNPFAKSADAVANSWNNRRGSASRYRSTNANRAAYTGFGGARITSVITALP